MLERVIKTYKDDGSSVEMDIGTAARRLVEAGYFPDRAAAENALRSGIPVNTNLLIYNLALPTMHDPTEADPAPIRPDPPGTDTADNPGKPGD